jgi:hypothetical protein
MERERRAKQALAVVIEPQSESLGESPGPDGEERRFRVVLETSKASHATLSLDRFGGTKQHGGGAAVSLADDVHTGVDTVAAVAIEASGGSEHRPVALRRAGVRMGSGVAAIAQIGLYLRDLNHESFAVC